MSYSELIKSFEKIRSYLHDFYIFGYKSRTGFTQKSSRSYDNQRRRIEDYFSDYIQSRQSENGKNLFLSIDSRNTNANPFYRAFKSKSFTDGDITLHFIIFDILYSPKISLSLGEIIDKIDNEYLSKFKETVTFDQSTIRKKLNECVSMGLVSAEKIGRQSYYKRAKCADISAWEDAVRFFSEVSGCGVIGSFLLERFENPKPAFSYKHHYISNALDSEVLYTLFTAINEKRCVNITIRQRCAENKDVVVVPLRIYGGSQNGRQHMFGYNTKLKKICSYRLSLIKMITIGDKAEAYDELYSCLDEMAKHLWGVAVSRNLHTEHVEFTVKMADDEEYIYNRLVREKRCGEVIRIDKNSCKYVADVYDTYELLPWIRTFICRITVMNFENKGIESRFKNDLEKMYENYGIGGDEE